jgi:hypothetical protein
MIIFHHITRLQPINMSFYLYQRANGDVYCECCDRIVQLTAYDDYCVCGNTFQPLTEEQQEEMERDKFMEEQWDNQELEEQRKQSQYQEELEDQEHMDFLHMNGEFTECDFKIKNRNTITEYDGCVVCTCGCVVPHDGIEISACPGCGATKDIQLDLSVEPRHMPTITREDMEFYNRVNPLFGLDIHYDVQPLATPMTYQLSVPCPEDPELADHWNSVLKSRQENAACGRDYYQDYLEWMKQGNLKQGPLEMVDYEESPLTIDDILSSQYEETIHPVTPVTNAVPEITAEMNAEMSLHMFAAALNFRDSLRARETRHQFAKLGFLPEEYIDDETFKC